MIQRFASELLAYEAWPGLPLGVIKLGKSRQ